MSGDYDGGIVSGYIGKFKQLGVEAIAGEDVTERLEALVAEANDHLDVWKVGDPIENKRRLIGQLKIQAELLAGGSPEQAKLLMDGAALLTAKLPA